MRRISAVILAVLLLFSAGCAKTETIDFSQATLKFIYADREIVQVLDADDTAKIAEMFSSRIADRSSIPSCGFDEDISITFGDRVFAIAGDDCPVVKDCAKDSHFYITEADKAYLVSLFEEYGGFFPCV